ncbi:hypothetical protein [Chitinivibrio alkaliphilus]|uniref:Uncharacterized protein n=1 Tax=Chitinivibrio alkaliphilus ACht1 TaxID=1313304 RepID=U7D5H1_9BACT|nr:hypothetical protein [Chitinivibrio alkaliphilus]ERP31203.1 hypothetical protein CALK_1916 [Chitinivibrio alkaliphilus ACht1]
MMVLPLRVFRAVVTAFFWCGVVLVPFVGSVWKEGRAHVLTREEITLRQELRELQSRIAAMGVEISHLTHPRRLGEYRALFDDLEEATMENTFYVRRERSSQETSRRSSTRDFFEKLLRPLE